MEANHPAASEPAPRPREQDRAGVSQTAVYSVAANDLGDYVTKAKNLPAMVQNMGLAGSLAFLASKGAGERKLADHLATWLLEGAGIPWPPLARHDNEPSARYLLRKIGAGGTSGLIYLRATQEARIYAGWLKRWGSIRKPAG